MNKEVKYEGKYLKFINLDTWEFVERKNCDGAVIIISKNKNNEVILVEQLRRALGKKIIEFPAGLIGDTDSNEAVETAASRELEEETGYLAEKITYLASGPSAPGLTNEMIYFVMAENLEKVSAGGGVDNENITVHEVPLDRIEDWLKNKENEGFMIDIKIYSGLYFLRSR